MRRAIAILAVIVATFTFAPVVTAGTQGGCVSGDTTKVYAYENNIGDHSDGDDMLYICDNIANLGSVAHTLSGGCKSTFPLTDTWNDCISSITTFTPSSKVICVYNDANYHDLSGVWGSGGNGVRKNIAADSTSSLKWIPSGDTCPG